LREICRETALDKERKNPSSAFNDPTDENAGENAMSLALTTILLTGAIPVVLLLCIEILIQSRRADRNAMRDFRRPH
jgi:hypothetical protein